MKGETWPYRVRVRQFKHFRTKREEGGSFGNSYNPSKNNDTDSRNNKSKDNADSEGAVRINTQVID